jgi:hypothetical protein
MIYALSASVVSENGLETLALVSRRQVCVMQNLLIWLGSGCFYADGTHTSPSFLNTPKSVYIMRHLGTLRRIGILGIGEYATTVPSYANWRCKSLGGIRRMGRA